MDKSTLTYVPLFSARREYYPRGPHLALKFTAFSLQLAQVREMRYYHAKKSPGPADGYNWYQWTRLGDAAFDVFNLAIEYAKQIGNRVVRPEHLLLGIIAEGRTITSGIDLEGRLSPDFMTQLPPDPSEETYELTLPNDDCIRISEATAKTLSEAVSQAKYQKAFYVDVYHLLAGVANTDCCAGALLVNQGLSSNEIYNRIKQKKRGDLLKITKADERAPYDPYKLTGRIIEGYETKYKLVRFVGIGGMGAVYAAIRMRRELDPSRFVLEDLILQSPLDIYPVCVKFLKPDVITQHPLYGKAFKQEIEIVKELIHPHIVRIADTGETDDGLLYYVMEWVDGKSLEEVVNKSPLSVEESLVILKQVCSALDAAHQQKIIHLDLKPGNIMMSLQQDRRINAKIIDFGLAKVAREVGMTTTLTQIGFTLQYCAPEVFLHQASPRSDVFSLGATTYVMLTGVIPFGMSYVFAKQNPGVTLPLPPSVTKQRPELPPAIDVVISKALQREPHLRQRSAIEFLEEYKDAIAGRVRTPTEILEKRLREKLE